MCQCVSMRPGITIIREASMTSASRELERRGRPPTIRPSRTSTSASFRMPIAGSDADDGAAADEARSCVSGPRSSLLEADELGDERLVRAERLGLRRSSDSDAAVTDDRDAIRDRQREVHVLLGEQHACPRVPDVADPLADLADAPPATAPPTARP